MKINSLDAREGGLLKQIEAVNKGPVKEAKGKGLQHVLDLVKERFFEILRIKYGQAADALTTPLATLQDASSVVSTDIQALVQQSENLSSFFDLTRTDSPIIVSALAFIADVKKLSDDFTAGGGVNANPTIVADLAAASADWQAVFTQIQEAVNEGDPLDIIIAGGTLIEKLVTLTQVGAVVDQTTSDLGALTASLNALESAIGFLTPLEKEIFQALYLNVQVVEKRCKHG